jgi:hypothetical protein
MTRTSCSSERCHAAAMAAELGHGTRGRPPPSGSRPLRASWPGSIRLSPPRRGMRESLSVPTGARFGQLVRPVGVGRAHKAQASGCAAMTRRAFLRWSPFADDGHSSRFIGVLLGEGRTVR